MRWLKKRFSFINLQEYITLHQKDPGLTRDKLALTFDDGYKNTYALVAPVLIEESIPTTFFVNTSNLDRGLLWFVYFNALCFEGTYPGVNINARYYPLGTKRNSMRAWKTLIRSARSSADARLFAEEFAGQYPLPAQIQDNMRGFLLSKLTKSAQAPSFLLEGIPTAIPIWTSWGRLTNAKKWC